MSPRRRAKRKAGAPAAPPLAHGSLGAWLHYLGAELADPEWIPVWPPDAFAISAAFLQRTGGYIELMNGRALRSKRPKRSPAWRGPEDVGLAWRQALERAFRGDTQRLRDACPPEIKEWWSEFRRHAADPLTSDVSSASLIDAACRLCTASDSASAGIGIQTGDDGATPDLFLVMADTLLTRQNNRRSFCSIIRPDALAVLGKQHTPQRGCTIRSLSHNLALYTPREILARWSGPYRPSADDPDVLNLLLLPWPLKVHADDFTVARGRDGRVETPPARVQRYFDYAPKRELSKRQIASAVRTALRLARGHADQIHGIVFPELSLNPDQFQAVERVAVAERAMLVAGVRAPASTASKHKPVNFCAIQPAGLTKAATGSRALPRATRDQFRLEQLKHHRWCLDRDQILQYDLGGRLPASFDCWEHMFIGPRQANFVSLASWLTVSVLICEDLARQDPVSEVIRAVGPNLVFALLMDGPQLRKRWPARYASVLAEDPGCSVLTLTSLGMATRSKQKAAERDQEDKSRTIALWRDAIFGEQEIAIGPGDNACVLSLVCRSLKEHTIDGRTDEGQAHFPVFAGAYPFAVPGRLP